MRILRNEERKYCSFKLVNSGSDLALGELATECAEGQIQIVNGGKH